MTYLPSTPERLDAELINAGIRPEVIDEAVHDATRDLPDAQREVVRALTRITMTMAARCGLPMDEFNGVPMVVRTIGQALFLLGTHLNCAKPGQAELIRPINYEHPEMRPDGYYAKVMETYSLLVTGVSGLK